MTTFDPARFVEEFRQRRSQIRREALRARIAAGATLAELAAVVDEAPELGRLKVRELAE